MYDEFNVPNLKLNIPFALPSKTSLLSFIPSALLKVVTVIVSPGFKVYPSVAICPRSSITSVPSLV